MKMRNKKQIQTELPSALGARLLASTRGFTQLDLMAVIAVLCVLFLILLPAIAKPGLNSKTIQCINNNRQLCNAWRMYADDNNDTLLYASTYNSTARVPTADPTIADNYAWSGSHMDYNGANRANWDVNYDMANRRLWAYNKSQLIYKCPSDTSTVVIYSGKTYPRILSMAMNLFVGGFAPSQSAFASGTTVGNDGGNSTIAASNPIYSKLSLINSPSRLFVFLDMRQDAQNWSNFMQDMTGYSPNNPASYRFSDIPGMYHNRAASFSFADGHTEMKRWLDSRTTPPLLPQGQALTIGASPSNPDIYWLQSHSTVAK